MREDRPRYLGHFTAVSLVMFLLLVSSIIPVNFTFATTEGQFPPSIIASSSTDTTPHLLKLKATQQGGTETRVSGFSLDTTSAVSAQANSQLLVLVTDSSLRVTEAKVRTASNQVINLVPAASQQAGAFSLANLPGGVYTLDVITQKGNAKGAYEGVLSIGNQPRTLIEETTKRVTNEYGDLILIFLSDPCIDNPDLPECQDPCEINPDLPECQDPCEINPDLPECPLPIIDIDCGNGITVPEVEECPVEVEDEADDEDQFPPIEDDVDDSEGNNDDESQNEIDESDNVDESGGEDEQDTSEEESSSEDESSDQEE